jgi:hypothetical protein
MQSGVAFIYSQVQLGVKVDIHVLDYYTYL